MKWLSMFLILVAVFAVIVFPTQVGASQNMDEDGDTPQCQGNPLPPTISDIPPHNSPEGIWYGCLCEELYWWSCDDLVSWTYYKCCDLMVWQEIGGGYWQCLTGYYYNCGLPYGCDSVPW